MSLFRRRRKRGESGDGGQRILVVGLGNPGQKYAGTRHNIGFEVAGELARRWGLKKPKEKFNSMISEGLAGPGGPPVVVQLPQTFMNESGNAVGPARGSLKVPLDRLVVVHDEIDLPFGEVRAKLGGGLAGHNGLKSLGRGLGQPDFWRVRVGVGRPAGSDPEVVSSYVLSRFREPDAAVRELIESAADEAEGLVRRVAAAEPETAEAKALGDDPR